MNLIQQSFLVEPHLNSLKKMADKAKQVAFTDIQPIFAEAEGKSAGSYSQVEENRRRLLAFRLSIEGPQRDVNYFSRLISEANLIQPNSSDYLQQPPIKFDMKG